ncbi:MAG: hypothetical protein EOP85_05445 [Verrucomicrobiaceae bacterium]|nr:MAG: hypothetical protein EOP85_05445 [Verrucomicrobiaceae bacterium]
MSVPDNLPRRANPPAKEGFHSLFNIVAGTILVVFLVVTGLQVWSDRHHYLAGHGQNRAATRDAAVASLKKATEPQVVSGILTELDNDTSQFIHNGGIGEIASHWFQRDYQSAFSLVAVLPSESRVTAFRHAVEYYHLDPERFLNESLRLVDSRIQSEVTRRIFDDLGKNDPAKGLALLARAEEEIVRTFAIESLFLCWSRVDPDAARAAAEKLEKPGERDRALNAVNR